MCAAWIASKHKPTRTLAAIGRQPQDGQQCRPGDGATVGPTVGRAFESVTDRSRRVGDALTSTKCAERHRQEIRRLRIEQERTGDESGVSRTALGSAVPEVVGRRAVPRLRGASVAAEAAGQVDVEGVEVEVAHLGEAFGGPGAGQGLGELVAPVLVLGLQGTEFGQGRGPPRRPGLRPGRTSRLNGDAGGMALAEAALPFSGCERPCEPYCNAVT